MWGTRFDWQMRYNPNIEPDPDWWHSLSREEKINSVLDSHSALWDEVRCNARLHAIAHVTVEDLLASGRNSPVRTTLRNLMAQGLTRHQAIHAIATVILKRITEEIREGNIPSLESCLKRLSTLTALSWARRGEQLESSTPHKSS